MTNIELKDIKVHEEDGQFYFDLTYRIYRNGKVKDIVYTKVSNPFSTSMLPYSEVVDESTVTRYETGIKTYYIFKTGDGVTDASNKMEVLYNVTAD